MLDRNLDLLLGLENRILYTAIDILEGECRLDQVCAIDNLKVRLM
jgi:septum site-determining protein MinD